MRALPVTIGNGAIGLLDRQAGRLARDTQEQLCLAHYMANVLDRLPTRFESQAKQASMR